MSLNISCFDYIYGLSRTECSCYTPPSDADVSNSGLYLDELESLRALTALENCENGNDVWDLLDNARDESIRTFLSDANAKLLEFYILKRSPFYGSIGRRKWSTTRGLTSGYYAGVRMACADIVSGIAKITKINTLFDTTGTINLTVYNNFKEVVATETLSTVANTHTENIVNIELPLHVEYIDNVEYFFIYTVGANQPLDNKIDCACGKSRLIFNTEDPYYFRTQTNKQYGWANYAMIGGFYDSSIDDLDDCGYSANSYLNGLTFQAEFKCKINDVLCEDYLDFEANPLALAMAHAMRYKAGEILINQIQLSPNLNRDMMINSDEFNAAREVYITKYDELLKYIIDRIDVTINDCLECRDIQEVIKAGIFS